MTNKVYQSLLGFIVTAVFAMFPLLVNAQTTEAQSRYPATGLAVLDCKPSKPAPRDSCVLRVPLGQLRGKLTKDDIGDASGQFEFIQQKHELFPNNLTLSATILLIDLTAGPGGGRNRTLSTEKALLETFVKGLPEDETIAVYGFNESLERLVDFTEDRSRVIDAIKGLRLRGTNTRIATHAKAAIGILDSKKDVLFKNLIIVSDGEEEGIGKASDVTKVAVDAKVSISALGMFWRAIGAPQTGAGMDYLQGLANEGFGSAVSVQLRNTQQSKQEIEGFVDALRSSWENSGLIVPLGTPQPADILVPMQIPVAGVEGNFKDKDIKARFEPHSNSEGETGNNSAKSSDQKDAMLFGYPALWIYVGAGIGVFLLLMLLVLLLRRTPEEQEVILDDDNEDIEGFDKLDANDAKTRIVDGASEPAAAAVQSAHSYLVRKDTRARLALFGQRISIGRDKSNVVSLKDDSISRVHAEIHRNRNGGYSVTDMDSLNGTFVNNNRISGTQDVQAGDVLKFGEIETKLVLV